MALGNLSIHVSADINGFTSSMDQAAAVAKSRMGKSSDAVAELRDAMLATSTAMQQFALAVGANMDAANDAIAKGSNNSAAALEDMRGRADAALDGMQKDVEEKTKTLGDRVKEGLKSGLETAFDVVKRVVETAFAVAAIKAFSVELGAIAVKLLRIYAIYEGIKALGSFAVGLVTGDAYKSKDIDAVIAYNDKIKDLQENLHLSSIEAGALNDALGRLGVDKADYTTVFQGVDKAIHSNTEELDRLGVKYKDVNGQLLQNRQILENAKKVLEEYTEGYSRNAAAAAIGMGTYKQISDALKINAEETAKSKQRLDEYQLGMSQYGQEAIQKYEQAMREFQNENRLFGDGIKRVISDAVMPAFTDLANFFKDGWPSVVRAFRVGVSSIVGVFYGMKDAIYIVTESIIASVSAIASVVMGLTRASTAIESGDFAGAASAVAKGWEDAKARIKQAGTNIVTQITENDKKIELAAAGDRRDRVMLTGLNGDPKGKKTWIPADPKKALAGEKDDPARKAFEGYLKQQDDFIAAEKAQLATREQFMQTYYNQEYMTARDFYGRKIDLIKENLQTELDAYDREIKAAEEFRKTRDKEQDRVAVDNKIADIQRKKAAAIVEANKQIGQSQLELMGIQRQFDLATQEWSHQRDLQNVQAAQNIALMGRSTLEVQKLTEAYRIDAEVQERIYQLRKKDPNADVSGALAEAEKQKAIAMQMIQAAWDKQQSAAFGASEAIRKYGEEARNYGQQVESVLTNAFRGMEDAFANFVTTGKFGFKDLINSITADLARMSFKTVMSNLLDSFKGSSIGQSIMGAFGSSGSSITGAASTTATNTALSTLGTTAATSTTALTTLTTSITAQDTAMATATASLGALAAAADTAAAALAGSSASGGASGAGALAGLAGGTGAAETSDIGWEAMLAGAFAGGGDPPVGRPSLVGEEGPEIFVPKTAGTILPNDVFKSMGKDDSGQQQSNVFHFNFNVPQNFNRDSAKQLATQAGFATQRALRSIA